MSADKIKKISREMLIIAITIVAVASVVRVVEAGSLTPSALPASSMNSLNSVYDALVGTTFDSSAVTASSSGNALQIGKCIITRLGGGSCP